MRFRIVVDRAQLLQRLLRLYGVVERLAIAIAVVPALTRSRLAAPLGFLLLDVRAVDQHDFEQIAGRGRRVDGPR